jgi:hypothetical protein
MMYTPVFMDMYMGRLILLCGHITLFLLFGLATAFWINRFDLDLGGNIYDLYMHMYIIMILI